MQTQKPKLNMQKLYPSTPLSRLMFRAPLVLWRLGLGSLMGSLFLILTHRGRKSGLARRNVLEYHALDGKKYIVCAFGVQSDWFRNLLVDPHATVQSAAGEEGVRVQRVTEDEELARVFELFSRRDAPLTHWYLRSLGIEPVVEDVLAKKKRVNFLRLDPAEAETLPGLQKDLLWVWPLLGGLLSATLMLKFITKRKRD